MLSFFEITLDFSNSLSSYYFNSFMFNYDSFFIFSFSFFNSFIFVYNEFYIRVYSSFNAAS